MKVTLAAVAAAAGVSVPTVSKVVHGRADVAADATGNRVELATSLVIRSSTAAPRRIGAS